MKLTKPMISHIIRARIASWMDPKYFAVTSRQELNEMVSFLRDDWDEIEWREIVNRDMELEEELRHCALGTEKRRLNLWAYFNDQPEMKGA